MNCGMCVCVLLAALSSSCCLWVSAQPSQDEGHARPGTAGLRAAAVAVAATAINRRPARSAVAAAPGGALMPFTKTAATMMGEDEEEGPEPRTSLQQLIATLIARKGASRRNSILTSRASGPAASHRIKDRDYTGWMDFGRRSAEEYEYSS